MISLAVMENDADKVIKILIQVNKTGHYGDGVNTDLKIN